MSISTEITRLQGLKNKLRTKLIELGLVDNTSTLDSCVTAVEDIADNGAISQKLSVSTTSYTVPKGYHDGTGTVSIETEEKIATTNGEYTPAAGKVFSKLTVDVATTLAMQEKTATPTKAVQEISPDAGYDGLRKVTVGAIPTNYADVASVTAEASNVLANKVFVTSAGAETAGTMANNGTVTTTIDGLLTTVYTIPVGYHSGTGTVTLTNDIEAALAAI